MSYSATDSSENINAAFESLARPTASAESTAVIGKIIEVGKEYVKARETQLSNGGKSSINFIDYPGKLAGYKLDAVVAVANFKVNDRLTVSHALVVVPAISADQMRAQVDVRDRRYEYQAVAADIFDEQYKTKLTDYITDTVAGAGAVSVVGIITVPHQAKLNDVIIEQVVGRLVDDLRFSLYSELTKGNAFKMDNLINPDNEVLTGVVRYHPGDDFDAFGSPHRRDLNLEVTKSQKSASKDANPLSTVTSQPIGSVSAFVDYIYLGRGERRRNRRGRDDDFNGIYGLGVNITELTSGNYQLLEAQQLILQSSVAMIREEVLVKGMYPAGPAAVLRTAEALNVETAEEEFGFEDKPALEDWLKMNDLVVREGNIHIFMVVNPANIMGRLHSTFLAACDPSNPRYKEAYDELYDAADRATDNEFSKKFAASQEIGYIDPRVVLQGTFTDKNGQIRSLEEVDRFFLMSELGHRKRDEESLRLWDRVCYDESMDDAERLARIETVLDAALGRGNYNITGRGVVIELSPDYLAALADSFNVVGLSVATDGVQEEYNQQYHYRGRENYGTRGFDDRARYYRSQRRFDRS